MAISINDHDLFLSTTGPDRVPGIPLMILESDIGGSSSSWPLVIRHLSPFVRIYIHDRAGFGKSEANPLANNRRPKAYAEKAAEDLDKRIQ
jgi:pimeloyl-ACP methyl ester carboxylesterase